MVSDADPSLVKRFNALLRACVGADASDLHLIEGMKPCLRVHGPIRPLENLPRLTRDEVRGMIRILTPELDREGGRATSVDGAFSTPEGARFRYNAFRRSGGFAIALRRLEDRFRSLADLGLPDSLYGLCSLPNGLVVVSGATGAGKSTTLATLIDRINQSHACHIVTIEDPIEYIHAPSKAIVNQRQVGQDALSFNEALVASLRQDPDVILVGEIRDVDTIRTAITASETGHLVFTTVHAGDCVSTIERLVGVFPADEQDGIRRQLGLVLRCIVNQRLLVADGRPRADSTESRRERVVASEVLMVTPAVANLLVCGKSNQIYSAMEAGTSLGMRTLEQDLARLWHAGAISERTATSASKRPDLVRDRHRQMSGSLSAPEPSGRAASSSRSTAR